MTVLNEDGQITRDCEEHHIVIVIGGYKSVNLATALFKSLLQEHQGPLFFHFITDSKAEKVLPTLFDTWNLPSVRYRTYDMEPYKEEVNWIPNSHYSSIYGVMRFVIPYILPEDVKEVLFMDTDLIALNDITPVFDLFKGTKESVLFAMAENLSPWYVQKGHWPARDSGFNAGVIFLHLERMRKANWREMWKKEAKERFKIRKTGNDQDILNALTLTYPNIVIELPCEYNFQLGAQGQPLRCKKEDRFVKMAHFNSRDKLNLKSKFVVHFARFHAMYQSMDGYVFRQRERCEEDKSNASTLLSDLSEKDIECRELLDAINTIYRTHLYFNGFLPSTVDGDVTLVTHLSVDRFEMFGELLESWEGPVSAAIYCTDAEMTQIEKFIKAAKIAKRRKNIALHAVFKTGNYYPMNYLRNVALNASSTDFVYLTDVDFIPSKGLYKYLLSTVKTEEMEKTVLVVPSFEILSSEILQLPTSRDELLKEWEDGKIRLFGIEQNHNATDYEKWTDADAPYEIDFNPSYQLSAVIARQNNFRYDERLIGYGWYKDTHLSTLHEDGYRLMMVPSAFTVHHLHASSFEISRFTVAALYKKCMRVINKQFPRDFKFQKLAQAAAASKL